MEWIVNNWSLLVVLLAIGVVVYHWTKKFSELPSEEQLKKVKEWLLWAVVIAERELGGGTGQLKLRYVYNLFIEKFPSLVTIISFDLFSQYVDEALEKMKHLLETNKEIDAYVKYGLTKQV